MSVRDVLLDHTLLLVLKLGDVADDGDSTASAEIGRLADPNVLGGSRPLGASEVLNELLVIVGQSVRGGHKVVDLAEHVLQAKGVRIRVRTYPVFLDKTS